MLTVNEEIKKIIESFFPGSLIDTMADYGNAVKFTVLDESKKKVFEETILLSEVCDGQELDGKKLASHLNSISTDFRAAI